MKRKLVIFSLILTLLALPLVAACAKPAPAPTPAPAPPSAEVYTLTGNWESLAGRDNIVTFPYRPGGYFEQMVTRFSEGRIKLDIKERLYGATESVLGRRL